MSRTARVRAVTFLHMPAHDSDLLQFRAVFFDAADAMLIFDDQRTVVEANRAACTLFRVPPAAIRERKLESLLGDDARRCARGGPSCSRWVRPRVSTG